MIRLYVSQNIYKEHHDVDDDLGQLFNNPSVNLFLDIDETPKEQDNTPDVGKSVGLNAVKAGKRFVDLIRGGKNIEVGLSRCVCLLDDIDEAKAKSIKEQYGILCYTSSQVGDLIKDLTAKAKYTTKKGNDMKYTTKKGNDMIVKEIQCGLTAPTQSYERGWNFYFEPFCGIPTRSLLFIDRYLLTNTTGKKIKNVTHIIKKSLSNNNNTQKLHILFIVGSNDNSTWSSFSEWIKRINEEIKDVCSFADGNRFVVEYIYCDNKNDEYKLYTHIHDRHVYSNYMTIDAPKSVAAFEFDRNHESDPVNSAEVQKISVLSCFPDGVSYSLHVESEEDSKSSYINDIAKDLADGVYINTYTPDSGNYRYDYYAYHISKDKIDKLYDNSQKKVKIINPMIVDEIEIKDGDQYWCLSVPDCSDWANIVVERHIFYEDERDSIKHRIWVREKKVLVDKCEEIKRIILEKNYHQVTNEGGPFFRVVADFDGSGVVRYERSEECNRYEGNCFKNESDAKEVANKIKIIIETLQR